MLAKDVGNVKTQKRTRGERERDLEAIEEMYLRGLGERAIAKELAASRDYAISHQQVHREIKKVQQRWRKEQVGELSLMKTARIVELQHLKRKAWREFERSQSDYTKNSGERREGGAAGDSIVKRVEKGERIGNPRFLEIVRACIHDEMTFLGLDKVDMAPTGEMTTEDIIRIALSPGGYGAVPGTLPPEAYLERKEAEALARTRGIEPMSEVPELRESDDDPDPDGE